MTDAVQIALIASVGPTIIGVLNIVHQIMIGRKVNTMGDNLKMVEKQTNSMKDALVMSTAKASHAEGVMDEKIRASVESNVPIQSVVAGPVVPKPL